MTEFDIWSAMTDATATASLVARSSWRFLFISWILRPFGLLLLLFFVVALDSLIGLGTVKFPASVACLLILFFALLAAELVLKKTAMETLLETLEIATGFSLRTMNLYFTPSFVILPLSPPIGGAEVGALIGVFVVGYIAQYILTAYTSRALQLWLGKPRKAGSVRSHESEKENEELPVAIKSADSSDSSMSDEKQSGDVDPMEDLDGMREPLRDGTRNSQCLDIETASTVVNESPKTRTRPERWADSVMLYLDIFIYLFLFIFIGMPVYYATGYTMPIFLCFNILMYFGANAIPPKIKRVAHPVLVTSLFTVLGLWVMALTQHHSLDEGLHRYQTQARYLQYFRGQHGLPLPGAGDILDSILDASIVSLAMPMYQYRKDLYHFFIAISVPTLALAVPSLFGYPPLCLTLGISAARSLSMAPRSVTLALAQISAANLGGDMAAISPIAVVSGISGAIFGPSILRMLRIPKDDYVTTGVVLGANSSAIATAMLLDKDKNAAALSALSMSIFGISFVVATAIPPLVAYLRSSVGL